MQWIDVGFECSGISARLSLRRNLEHLLSFFLLVSDSSSLWNNDCTHRQGVVGVKYSQASFIYFSQLG